MAAMDSMSGLTSQPNLGSIVEALRFGQRDPGLDGEHIRTISHYWGQVRKQYAAFESDNRAGASEVYVHGMPGGQYTNLREQARALGIDDTRWPEVARTYAEVNDMFGDVIKVTPTSKVVGDMALLMVSSGLTPRGGARSRHRDRIPRIGGAAVSWRCRPATWRAFRKPCSARSSRVPNRASTAPGLEMPPADLDAVAHRGRCPRGPHRDRPAIRLLPDVPGRVHRVRRRPTPFQRRGDPAHAGVLLRHGGRAGDQCRPGARQDADRALCDAAASRTRTARARCSSSSMASPVQCASSIAARQPKRPPPRKVDAGNPRHIGAPMPGTVTTIRRGARPEDERGRCRRHAGGDEDGGRGARRDRWRGGRGAGAAWPPVDAKDLLVVLR